MFRYMVTLLFINTFYCSFGYPLEVNETLGKSLQLLADNCQNKFLSGQIKTRIEACDIMLSADREIKETELECLIFYDINSQLCSSTELATKLDLNETYNSEINQVQNVANTCADASKNWKFTNLTVYPKYYNTSQKVFKELVKCVQACGAEIVVSEDTNFFCKYYQWGSKLLQLPSAKALKGDTGPGSVSVKTPPSVPSSSIIQNPPNNSSKSILEQPQSNNAQEQAQAQLEVPNYRVQTDLDNTEHVQPLENAQQLNNEHTKVSKPDVVQENQLSIVATQSTTTKNNTILNKPSKDMPKSGKNVQSDDDVEDPDDGAAYDSGDTLDDAQLPRSHANDNNDPSLETEPRFKEDKKDQPKPVESIVSSLDVPGAQKEIYSNTMSEQFGEVDDHFFSFFLTATILVIFFYVLYHNKSKFRKVFLGLLVEGRQPGRRRNSRGHEYRRLDTLEQAMSTNSAAPPSKIIY